MNPDKSNPDRSKSGSTRPGRRTNLALLILLPLAIVTGLVANTAGTRWGIHPSVFHGVIALAIVILTPWKQAIVRRGLRSWTASTWISVSLLVMVLTTLTTGIMHALGYRGRIGPLTLMQVHIGGAVADLILMWFHYRSHPVRVNRRVDLSRRGFLRTATFAAVAGAVWVGLEGTLDAAGLSGGRRRFTGSHERASFDPLRLPVTSWLDDAVQNIDAEEWTLDVDGRSLTMEDIAAMEHESFDAILDCTSAWYSEQTWTGVRLDRLLDPGDHPSVEVRSQTGYARRFPAHDLPKLWLVTHVGGEPLSAGNGYPARIVAPDRRGYWWVKWVVSIRPSSIPWWVQSPFPLT
jgi:hypothetical protein